jgi:glycosyltransferase involved in cell wall biosynthesis
MKASILINNYNYQNYIDECLSSVLKQDYNNIEIVLFDDASTDDSLNVVKKYLTKIHLLENQNPKAKAKFNSHNQHNAIIKAFEKSTGDIIFLLDSDDYFMPSKVKEIMRLYETLPHVNSIQDTIITQIGKEKIISDYLSVNRNFNPLDFVLKTNLIFCLGPQTSGLSFRRHYFSSLLKSYNFNVPLIWPDIQFGRKALFENMAFVIKKPLTVRRIHDSNDSLKLKKEMSVFLDQYTIWFNEYFKTTVNLNYKIKSKLSVVFKTSLYFIKKGDLISIKRLFSKF